jgi:hypothetical protein
VSFAGVFATSRNTTNVAQYLDATFTSFSIETDDDGADPGEPFEPFEVQVNFQSEGADVPAGFVRDFGEPFGSRTGADQGGGLSYGWVDPDSGAPLSLVGNGRDRDRTGIPQELDTIIHMQYGDVGGVNGVLDTGAWEIAVPDGIYEVTFSVGDEPGGSGLYDSLHAINVNYALGLEGFQATAANEYETATTTVSVTDGPPSARPGRRHQHQAELRHRRTHRGCTRRHERVPREPLHGRRDRRGCIWLHLRPGRRSRRRPDQPGRQRPAVRGLNRAAGAHHRGHLGWERRHRAGPERRAG